MECVKKLLIFDPERKKSMEGRDECGVSVLKESRKQQQMNSSDYETESNAKYPVFSSKSKRLLSFEDWPLRMRQSPEDLAEAGFFYTGRGDRTLCFYCGGGLKDWEDKDEPWQQHAQWFSQCAYLRLRRV